jgi:hypothetical protein
MGSRNPRCRRPSLEEFERRQVCSAIADIMAGNSIAAAALRSRAAALAGLEPGVRTSSESIAVPENQGPLLNPDGTINNQALAPTGTVTARELKRERFTAHFAGTFTVGAGRTSDESIQTFIAAAGTANTMRHSDIQLLLVTPKDRSLPIGGVSAIFDRNLNTNTVLGFDEAAPQSPAYINRLGLPALLPTVSIDVNLSSGTYDEAYAIGTIRIHYIPSDKRTPGVILQGHAVVTIRAQIYTPNVGFILRNANLDP